MYRMILLLVAFAAAGCSTSAVVKDVRLQAGEHGRVDIATASNHQAHATMTRAQINAPSGLVDQTFLDRGESTQAKILAGLIPGVATAATHGVFGYLSMDRKADAMESQQPSQTNLTLVATGGPAIANANTAVQAGADVAITGGCGLPICP